MNVGKIMHSNVKSCQLTDSLDAVANIMWQADCGAVPVLNQQQQVKGMITDRDIAMAAALQHRPLWEIHVADLVQNKPLYSSLADDDIHTTLTLMAKHQVRRVPVISKSGNLEGIVSTKDVLEHIQSKPQKSRSSGDQIAADEAIGALQAICKPNLVQASAA